ncbi:MAG: hypothetical protein ACYC5F_06190 [Thermoleophilia bacterium]
MPNPVPEESDSVAIVLEIQYIIGITASLLICQRSGLFDAFASISVSFFTVASEISPEWGTKDHPNGGHTKLDF